MSERFYLSGTWKQGDTVRLEGVEHHHMAHVMKVKVGEEVELLNGKGARATVCVKSLDKRGATLEILEVNVEPTSKPRFILALPLMRLSKLEWVIEKGTELGADAFWLYPADFSEKEHFSDHQMDRLNYIAISAMKQCGRADLPPIVRFKSLAELFKESTLPCLFGDVRETAMPMAREEKCLFVTGPEKGFSEKEEKLLEEKGKGVHLHKNILRAETAPIAALSMLIALNS